MPTGTPPRIFLDDDHAAAVKTLFCDSLMEYTEEELELAHMLQARPCKPIRHLGESDEEPLVEEDSFSDAY